MFSAQKTFFYQDHRYIRFDPINLHGFSRWFRILQRKNWVIWLKYGLYAKYLFISKFYDSSYKPLVKICCRGIFLYNLIKFRAVYNRFKPILQKSKNYKNSIFLIFFLFKKSFFRIQFELPWTAAPVPLFEKAARDASSVAKAPLCLAFLKGEIASVGRSIGRSVVL